MTWLGQADLLSMLLALCTCIALWAQAPGATQGQFAATTIIAGELKARHAAFAVQPGVALKQRVFKDGL